MSRVAVLGAGAWGTALATVAARAGHAVVLCGRDPALMAEIARSGENHRSLPGVRLSQAIAPTADLRALEASELVLAAIPAQALRAGLHAAGPHLGPATPIVVCAKGIERGSGLLMSDVVQAMLPGRPALALSGPSFAADVGRGMPTAVTLAADTLARAAAVGARLATPEFRLYHTDDLVGVEIGGAVKNVLAIACGIAIGRGLGASAVAALTARAFAELQRFARAFGARADTLMGLSGLGDLVLTCGTTQSRNFALGVSLGRGNPPGDALTEGVATAPILVTKAREHGLDMPIVTSVDAILAGRLDISEAIEALLARPSKAE